MPINVACDHCGQSLQVLEEHAGKQVRCPKCYQVFVAKASAAAPPAAVPPPPTPPPPPPDPNALAQGVVSAPSPAVGGQRFCAHCGTAMPPAAGFCPACGKAPPAVPPQVYGGSFTPGALPSPYAPIPQNNGLAVTALVLGILSWFCVGPLASIPAIICGHIARGQISRSNGMQTGDGIALGGLVLGYLNLLAMCGWFGLSMAGSRGSIHF